MSNTIDLTPKAVPAISKMRMVGEVYFNRDSETASTTVLVGYEEGNSFRQVRRIEVDVPFTISMTIGQLDDAIKAAVEAEL